MKEGGCQGMGRPFLRGESLFLFYCFIFVFFLLFFFLISAGVLMLVIGIYGLENKCEYRMEDDTMAWIWTANSLDWTRMQVVL